jgi:hypothetical protein
MPNQGLRRSKDFDSGRITRSTVRSMQFAARLKVCVAVLFALSIVTGSLLPRSLSSSADAQSKTLQYQQDLNQVFTSYEDLKLDPQSVAQQVKASGRLSLVTLNHRFDLQLEVNDLRAPNYRAEEVINGWLTRELPRLPVNTYKGTLAGMPGTDARFTIDETRIEGMIIALDETYFVESARKYSVAAGAADYLLYKASDVRPDVARTCGATLDEEISLQAKELSANQSVPDNVFSPLKVVEIATEADDEYVNALGSPAAANNDILGILNQIDAIYRRDIGLTFTVAFQHSWSGANDPYTANGDPVAVLTEFTNYWNANITTPRDDAHLWTGRSLGGPAGIAWQGVVCRDAAHSYGVSIFETMAPFKSGIPTHEIGHNFNATHCDGQGGCDNSIMVATQTQSNNSTFCQFSINEITNYVNANPGCLSDASAAATIELSSRSYSVGEGSGRATITITRTDTTGAASVNYATSDAAGLAECDTFNSVASQRCDYAISVGTLRFASGEGSKVVTIPIVDDVYAEGNENFTFTLSNPTGATLGAISTATVTIVENDSITGLLNPINGTDFFIRQHYIDFLGREPEPAGLQGWRDVLNNCAPGNINCDRVEVSSAFFRSPEFQDRGFFIYRFYPTVGRIPLYGEFMPDFAKVSGFLSAAELEANKVAFANEFVARSEFQTRYGALTNDAFVDALLQTVGLPNHPSKATWKAVLANGSMTRAQVVRALVDSTEMAQKYYTEAFVIMQYFGYLRRTADISYQAWITTMNQNPNNYRIMISGFLNSLEYRKRFGPN